MLATVLITVHSADRQDQIEELVDVLSATIDNRFGFMFDIEITEAR